jgi:EAL domain-containing protein (putative c-di-GMP-specific phosphodiesterase class I)/DNA-binding NarL/FixJ family response regulator
MQLEAIGARYHEAAPPDTVEPIRVMVADDEDAIRAALSSLLAADPRIVVIGEASDAQAAIEIATERRPNIALLDVRMPRGGGPRAAQEITTRSPDTRVIALSALEDAGSILEMLDAGASAYVGKDEDAAQIVSTIHRLMAEPPASLETSRERAFDELLGGRGWLDRKRQRAEQITRIIRAGGPRIVYQPLFTLGEGRCVGAEALSRFDALPTRSPQRWFEEAERCGLLVDLELAAVEAALDGLDGLPAGAFLSVNVSPVTCCAGELAETIARVDPERIVLEITEHAQVADYAQLDRCLAALRSRGVRVAVDDTGAGFASLSHVLAVAPELIKLDIQMCRDIEHDEARRALVHALADFAAHIGADVVAEGIESSDQLLALREAGVRLGQGFFLGPPRPLAASGGGPGW